jgi:hypothetical protein
LIPAISLFTGLHIVTHPAEYLILRLSTLALVVYFYYDLSGKTFSASQYWASLSFLYFKSLILAILGRKGAYKVTNKVKTKSGNELRFVWPHLLYLAINFLAIVWRLEHSGLDFFVISNIFWIGLMSFWFMPVIQKTITLPRFEFKVAKDLAYQVTLASLAVCILVRLP